MEIKKVFNKNIFKDKSFIKMVCFTVVLLLVLVLGSNFGYVSADSEGTNLDITGATTFMSYSGFQNSSLYDSSLPSYFQNYFITDPLGNENPSEFFTNITSFVSTNIHSQFPNYAILLPNGYSTNMNFSVVFWDEGCYLVSTGYNYIIAPSSGYHFEYFNFTCSGSNGSTITQTGHDLVSIPKNSNDYQGYTFYSKTLSSANNNIQGRFGLSNSPIYCKNTNGSQTWSDDGYWNTCWYLWHYLEGNEYYVNQYADINYGFADGLVGGSGSNGGASALNYLYADTADWWLNNDPTSSKFYNGSVTFNSSLNDYIIEHSDEYAINYDFECDIAFYYFFAPPSGQALNWQPTAACPFYKGIYGADIEDEVEDSAFEWHYFSCHFDFDNDITDDADDFISDGYGHRFSLYNDLYDNFDATGYLSDNTHITITPAEIIDLINGNFDGGGQLTIKQWSTFRIKCTAKIGAPSYINTSGSISDFISSASSATSGGYSETFDLLTGNSTLGDQSMLTNNNPYTELSDNTYDDTQLPSTGGTSGTTTVSTGNVTQTVNVTNEGAKYIPSLISKLIPTSIGDNTSGITERFYNLAQVNGFVTVMAETVPAVPNVIWTYCEDYLAITLYLLAVAFVLRLILDLL